MAGSLKHRFTNGIAQQGGFGGGGQGVGPNEWNDSLVAAGGNNGDVFERDSAQADGWKTALPYFHGQCRLSKSGSNLLLSPYNGNRIIINGKSYTLASAGYTLGVGGLAASTVYYIYVYDNAGTLTLEASTTVTTTDTTTGVAVKSGDATRTLVGLARTTSGTAWADSATQRFVLSYFNRQTISGTSAFTADRTTTATTFAEINSEIRVEILAWADEAVTVVLGGTMWNSSSGGSTYVCPAVDGTVQDAMQQVFGFVESPFAVTVCPLLSQGYHYLTLMGATLGVTTASYKGAASGTDPTNRRCVLYVTIRG